MSQQVLSFKLEQAAKKSGGDKYVCETIPEFNIYFPQSISRVGGVPKKIMTITVPKETEAGDDVDDDDDEVDYDENDD